MKRNILVATLLILIVGSAIALLNHFILSSPVDERLSNDSRNDGIHFNAHYQYYVNPSVIVLNLTKVDMDKAPVDVFRALLQTSNCLKNKNFNIVILEYKGKPKFKLPGKYFHKLGIEYEQQNPMYTLRTFPENVLNLDETQAFGSITGGLFGVLKAQMDQFSDFNKSWYLNDLNPTK